MIWRKTGRGGLEGKLFLRRVVFSPARDFSRGSDELAGGGPPLVRQTINDVVDTELVGFIGIVDRPQPRTRPFPELRDVGVVVDHHLQALRRIVVLEEAAEYRPSGDIRL